MLSPSLRRVDRAPKWPLLSCLLFLAFLVYLVLPPLWALSIKLYHANPFLHEHKIEVYDFHATTEEIGCLAGHQSGSGPRTSIPNIVHFIWGLTDGNEPHSQFGFIEYLSIRSALLALKPSQVKLHYATLDQSNNWLRKVKDNVTLVYHDPEVGVLESTHSWQAAHRADILRLDILREEGGIYMDLDVVALQSFDNILRNAKDVTMGHEGGDRSGVANAVILSRKESRFINRWLHMYRTFDPTDWNYHSVRLPKEIAMRHPEEICTLPPLAFFWPTWSYKHLEYMHSLLSVSDAIRVKEDLHNHSGALFRNQLAYHAWSQMSWDPYLKQLTPELVKNQDSRFNIMVRRFLE
ncbi:hypothetical protein MMC13_007972 [Lambiella insularis]|nr:hypothetical protein [Lambiella insularis]